MEDFNTPWDKLSLQKKAEIMDISLNYGLSDIGEIRKKYNSFADGGDTQPKNQYIGGTSQEARDKFWKTYPRMTQVTDSISDVYGIDANTLRQTLNREGFVDNRIKEHNDSILQHRQIPEDMADKWLQRDTYAEPGANNFGLDYTGNLIDEGKVKPIGANWEYADFVNEKGEPTFSVSGYTNMDNISLTAATIKYLSDIVKKDFPNIPESEVGRYVRAYYNRGVNGGRKWVRNGAVGYNINTQYGNGGFIHINPANKGKFNATKARTGKTTEELTHSKNPLTRKRAIFAQNAAKWNRHDDGGPLSTLKDSLEQSDSYNAAERFDKQGNQFFYTDNSFLPGVTVSYQKKMNNNLPGYDTETVYDTKYDDTVRRSYYNGSVEKGITPINPEFEVLSGARWLGVPKYIASEVGSHIGGKVGENIDQSANLRVPLFETAGSLGGFGAGIGITHLAANSLRNAKNIYNQVNYLTGKPGPIDDISRVSFYFKNRQEQLAQAKRNKNLLEMDLSDSFNSTFPLNGYRNEFVNNKLRYSSKLQKNLSDLQKAAEFGYIPKDTPISVSALRNDEYIDNLIKKGIKRQNTFVRGVHGFKEDANLSNDEYLDRLKYYATHYAGTTGAGRVGMSGYNIGSLYTSNSIPFANAYALPQHYGEINGKIAVVRRPLNFNSKNREDWINNNTLPLKSSVLKSKVKDIQDIIDDYTYDKAVKSTKQYLSQIGSKEVSYKKAIDPNMKELYTDRDLQRIINAAMHQQPYEVAKDQPFVTNLTRDDYDKAVEIINKQHRRYRDKMMYDNYVRNYYTGLSEKFRRIALSQSRYFGKNIDALYGKYTDPNSILDEMKTTMQNYKEGKISEKTFNRKRAKADIAYSSAININTKRNMLKQLAETNRLFTTEGVRHSLATPEEAYQHYIFTGIPNTKGLDFIRFINPSENMKNSTRLHSGRWSKGLSNKQYYNGGVIDSSDNLIPSRFSNYQKLIYGK